MKLFPAIGKVLSGCSNIIGTIFKETCSSLASKLIEKQITDGMENNNIFVNSNPKKQEKQTTFYNVKNYNVNELNICNYDPQTNINYILDDLKKLENICIYSPAEISITKPAIIIQDVGNEVELYGYNLLSGQKNVIELQFSFDSVNQKLKRKDDIIKAIILLRNSRNFFNVTLKDSENRFAFEEELLVQNGLEPIDFEYADDLYIGSTISKMGELTFVLSKDYPKKQPQLFLTINNDYEEIKIQDGWNSFCTLYDIINAANMEENNK